LLKDKLKLERGAQKPGTQKLWLKKFLKKTVEEIVDTKKADLTAGTKEAGMRTIEGSIRSMGLKVRLLVY
jgi:large subunit ribosomal protein L11